MKIARIYLRVSTIEQSNQRQEKIIDDCISNNYYACFGGIDSAGDLHDHSE